MTDSTFITRVVLENYKSIATCDVRLGRLTFLVGPNGAGKSNFLDALRFVADALQHSVGHALHSRGGGRAICYAPHQRQAAFHIFLEFAGPADQRGHYSLRVGAPAGDTQGRWEVREELLGLPAGPSEVGTGLRSTPQEHQRAFLGDRLALALAADNPAYRQVYEKLTRMRFYNIQPQRMEDVVTFEPGEFLPGDGSNVASVLFRLGMPGEEVVDRLNEYLRLILPGLVRARAEPVFKDDQGLALENQKVALLFEQRLPGSNVHLFWPSQMSQGTLRALGVLTALLQATVREGPRASLVAIEEPEA
jgi:predicted ATPase